METVFLIFFIVLSLSFAIAYLSVLYKLKKSNLALVETFVAKEVALDALIKTKKSTVSSDELVHKENFIKFLSDSRDWAFTYIEDVQLVLNKFVSDIEPEIQYFKENSGLKESHPYYFSIKKISESYEELKNLLPKEKS
jgi:predicted membrane protein